MSNSNPGESRIDAKIKRDALLVSGADDLWNQLWSATESACEKIKAHWAISLDAKLNEANSVIRVTAPVTLADDAHTRISPTLEIRFDRKEQKIVARLAHKNITVSYAIKADASNESLSFDDQSPLALAEYLIAERLLKLDLNK